MALSAIALCSRALLKLGARPISSFDEGTTESVAVSMLYPPIRDAMLSSYPWTFATAQKQLARLKASPTADYHYAWQLPSDFLRALSAGPDGRGQGIPYRIVENRLHSDAEAVTLTYIFRPHEAVFPAFFDQALMSRLSAELCLPLTESSSRSERLYRIADRDLRQARLIDAQQDVPPHLDNFPLIEVR